MLLRRMTWRIPNCCPIDLKAKNLARLLDEVRDRSAFTLALDHSQQSQNDHLVLSLMYNQVFRDLGKYQPFRVFILNKPQA